MVLVKWQDIVQNAEWKPMNEVDELLTMQILELGFYQQCKKNTKTGIRELVLNHSISQDGDSDSVVIPEGCVTFIQEVELK